MNKSIKELEDRGQEFGNMFGGFIGMLCVFAIGMFFYEGCSWRMENGADNILAPEEEKETSEHKFLHTDFSASDWVIYK